MKKLVFGLMVLLAASTVQASYLYWQVSDSAVNTFVGNGNYGYAKIYTGSYGSGTAQTIYYNGTDIGSDGIALKMNSPAAINVGDIGSSTTIYIELFRYDTSSGSSASVAVSEAATYSSLAEAGFITSSLTKIPQAWTGGHYVAPEPTSAMMLLVGFALLSLKRRKV